MIKRRLGADGPEITAVGYGSMSFGAAYGPTTRENSVAILDAMQDLGLDHFDTAYIYAGGEAETIFGDYCRQSPAARDFFTVATKGGIFTGPAAANDGFANNNSRAFLTEQLDTSLQRLGTDCVDLYYLHRWDRERTPIEEAMDTLAGFVKAGKIRSIGLSEVAPSTLRRAAAVHHVVDDPLRTHRSGEREADLHEARLEHAVGLARCGSMIGRLGSDAFWRIEVRQDEHPTAGGTQVDPRHVGGVNETTWFRAVNGHHDEVVAAQLFGRAQVFGDGREEVSFARVPLCEHIGFGTTNRPRWETLVREVALLDDVSVHQGQVEAVSVEATAQQVGQV